MTQRVLFVDDESMLLEGLRRSLRSMRNEWQMEFVESGSAALAAMECHDFDALVTDMRMPGMDGAELLELVAVRHPKTLRFVLSGQSSRDSMLQAVAVAHQCLGKPCDVEELKERLKRALALQNLLENPTVKQIASRLHSIPSLPAIYLEIAEELRCSEVSVSKVGQIIARDMGMSAKILQLVNSPLLGIRGAVASPMQAVSLVGLDNVKTLVLSLHVFSQLEPRLTELSWLWDHSLQTAAFAKRITHAQGADLKTNDAAFTAGMLHDVGKLLLATALPDSYRKFAQADQQVSQMPEAEQEAFGCTHGEMGAYLLGIWGLPDTIVEAVAWHHSPSHTVSREFCPLLAVHAADLLQHRKSLAQCEQFDQKLFQQLNMQTQIPLWEQACFAQEQ